MSSAHIAPAREVPVGVGDTGHEPPSARAASARSAAASARSAARSVAASAGASPSGVTVASSAISRAASVEAPPGVLAPQPTAPARVSAAAANFHSFRIVKVVLLSGRCWTALAPTVKTRAALAPGAVIRHHRRQ